MKLHCRKYYRCTIAAVAFGLLTATTPIQAESLQDAVQFLIDNHPEIQSTRYNRLARDQEVRQARAGYLPKVDFTAGAGTDNVDKPFDDELGPQEYTLSLRQNLFTGLATINEVERQQSRVRSEAYVLQATTEHTALKATRAYLEVLRSQDLVKLAKDNLQIHERIADQVSLRSQSGVDSKADLDQIESRLALARSNLIVTETNLTDAETNYLAVVGRMPADLIKPEPPDKEMPPSMEDAIATAVNKHPQLKSALADVDARISQEKVARSPLMPIVDVEVDKNWSEEVDQSYDEQENLVAMLRLRYNLFHGFQDQARKKETTLLVSEAREVRNNTQRQVEESIRLSWMAYKNTRNRIPYLEQRWKSASQTATAYNKQWDIGQRTLLDVLDAEAEQIDAQQELLNARFDGQIAQYRILDGMGTLVHTLGLKWPEEAMVDGEEQPEAEQTPAEPPKS